MMKSTAFICAVLAVASAQHPSPFFSYSNSPQSSSPFGAGPPPGSSYGGPSFGPPGGSSGPSFGSPGGFSGQSYSPLGGSSGPSFGPPGGPQGGRPSGFPSSNYKTRQSPPSKLFSWLGSTMSKLAPKIQYHPNSKPSHRPSGLTPSAQNAPPTYFSGPPHESLILPQIPNSIYESGPSPFGGSSISFAPNPSGPIPHSQVKYRSPVGPPPPSFSSRPGPSPSYSSRPPPSYSSRPQQFSPGPATLPPSYSSSSSPYSSPYSPPFPSSNLYASPPQSLRENLEVFPSQQVSYQSHTLNQNSPGYNEALSGGLQNLYGSQSNSQPSYYQSGKTNYEQESSYSQRQPQISNNPGNYGATFHNIEPVSVAPLYDIQNNFKASQNDLSGATSNSQQKQQDTSMHDTPFNAIINQYSAQADASTAGSEQVMKMMQMQGNSDLATAASSSAIPGVQILGQAEGNPVFEVVADPNAPTYDGHPVDLSKLISMIEPGAEIDTLPHYGDSMNGAASEQQSMYAEAPSNLDLESEAAMSSGGYTVSGNKKLVSGNTQVDKTKTHNVDLIAEGSESKPTILKPDGTQLNEGDDDKLIKEYFDKEIILDDLQDNMDKGFIIVGMNPDDETGDIIINGTDTKGTVLDNDQLLAIVQQLRNSANSQLGTKPFSVVNSLESPNIIRDAVEESNDETETTDTNSNTKTTLHPNHNYNPNPLSPKITDNDTESGRDTVPVINPILDSVRPNNIPNSAINFKVVDNDDDEEMYPDDMTVETDGDLAASASRNVKSVAIIVTPPPNYVKIKNKYKKVNGPVSSSTYTPTNTIPTPPPSIDDAFGESSNSSNRNQKSIDNSSIPSSATPSSLQVVNENNDSILKSISTISQVSSSNISSNNTSGTNESSNDNNTKKTLRYPVYRGRSSNASSD